MTLRRDTGNLAPQLAAQTAKIQEQVTALTDVHVTRIRDDINHLSHQLTTQVAKLQEHLEAWTRTDIHTDNDKLRDDLTCFIASNKTVLKNELEHSFATELASFRQELTKVQGAVEALQEPPKPPLKLREEGLIRQECPAPPSCSQEGYEGQLERAAWSYIFELGNPDDGAGEDIAAYKLTLERFPDLDEKGVSIALQHIHMRVYRHPFHRVEQDEGDMDTWQARSDSSVLSKSVRLSPIYCFNLSTCSVSLDAF